MNHYLSMEKPMKTSRKITLPALLLTFTLLISACGPLLDLYSASPLAQASALNASALNASATTAPASLAASEAPAASLPLSSASPDSLAALQATYEQVYQLVNPSVVNIQVEISSGQNSQMQPSTMNPFAVPDATREALGSGFVWDSRGHIVTNNHVVENASRILVTFADGTTVEAQLVGADPESDLAVIKVDESAVDLQPLTLVDSDQVKVGQLAIAIGNPYGLSGTMTEGIVSALSRSLPVSSSDGVERGTYTIPDVIQTNAAITPGNSGGVLVDVEGKVIGVTAAIRSSTDSNSGIGFVIPANIVNRVVPVLIDKGNYVHPRLGITATSLTYDLAEAANLDLNQRGVLVVNVTSGSPADRAGLRGSTIQASANGNATPTDGDIVTAIDGQPVKTFEDLTSYLFNSTEVGQTVELTVLRQGAQHTVQLTLSSSSSN